MASRFILSGLLSVFLLSMWGCASSKGDLPVVRSVDLHKYLGPWYEIMRLPNSFESGLTCVMARYSLKANGDIKVENSGHKTDDIATVKTATGTAWVPNPEEPAKLKVRFFWPFSGNYWIIALDPDYRYAMVGDPSRDYLWILAREKTLPEATLKNLLAQAQAQGFDTARLMLTGQECP